MRVAGIQHDIVWEQPDANFAHLAPMIEHAATGGARLVVLTEMFSTGFSMATDRIAEDRATVRARSSCSEQAARARRLAVRLGPGARPRAGDRRDQPARARRPRRFAAPLRQDPSRSPTAVSTSTTKPATRSSPSTSRGCGSASSSATTCASPTSSGRWPRRPTCLSIRQRGGPSRSPPLRSRTKGHFPVSIS